MVPKTKLPLRSSCWISFGTRLGACGTPELVDLILRNVTPVHEYEPNIWGPKASVERIIFGASWRKPSPSSAMLWLQSHSGQGLRNTNVKEKR